MIHDNVGCMTCWSIIRHHTGTILCARWNMTDVLRRRIVVKVNLEFTGSRNVLVIRLTLVCQVFCIGMKVYIDTARL